MRALLTFLLMLSLYTAGATNLRGQIVRYNPTTKTYFPLAGVRVDLWIYNGSQWVDISNAVTGQDGSYFFVNVAPGYLFRVQVFGNYYPQDPLTVAMVYPPNYQIIPTITT
jgi:hypothetical protein